MGAEAAGHAPDGFRLTQAGLPANATLEQAFVALVGGQQHGELKWLGEAERPA